MSARQWGTRESRVNALVKLYVIFCKCGRRDTDVVLRRRACRKGAVHDCEIISFIPIRRDDIDKTVHGRIIAVINVFNRALKQDAIIYVVPTLKNKVRKFACFEPVHRLLREIVNPKSPRVWGLNISTINGEAKLHLR